ncbi:hypothetical protein QM797_22050 [Rhodococcus sp. IEGM 1381]|uniref:hypothetical protein n=1 Tax=Rhodococcus sp. IEGM 1381 TaxID=3047085 RepID=UPI0024B7FCCC|nr:hypothetical protein [Rhodococcus sp. IEGM 1381]MDI9897410.1 hypothetical protein [Rhodococcus sp. IEGM 1381]
MSISAKLSSSEVDSDWADLSAVPGADKAFAHHGIAFTATGELVGFHAGQLVVIDSGGSVVSIAETELTEGHGVTVVREGDRDLVWIADPGFAIACGHGAGSPKLPPFFGAGLDVTRTPGRVVQMTIAGEIVRSLPTPVAVTDDAPGPYAPYAPTAVAVDETRFGGRGDIWVADGYGSNVVHRFDSAGQHIATLTGSEGAGRFDCPHSVFVDRRPGKSPELYVTDRGNARIAVYDLEGRFSRLVGEEFLDSPSGIAMWAGALAVVELNGRLTLLGEDDRLVGHVGDNPDAKGRPGWPNALGEGRVAQRPTELVAGRFNSPHAVAVDAHDRLVVAEWVIGGRYSSVTPS